MCAALVAGGLVVSHQHVISVNQPLSTYRISMTARAKSFVEAWRRGDQKAAIEELDEPCAVAQCVADDNDWKCARTLRPSEVSSYQAELAFRTLRTRPRFLKFFHARKMFDSVVSDTILACELQRLALNLG